MDVVIDASAIIAVVTNEPAKNKLVELTEGVDLIAPGSVHWEIGNAFSAMLKRKRATIEQVTMAVVAYHRIPLRFVHVELEESLAIANQFGLYAYDAYLLRCALKYKSPLLTLDSGLAHAAKIVKAKVLEVEA